MGLSDSEPSPGQVLAIEGHRWTVKERATYAAASGYHVTEWECERSDHLETAYLLREESPDVHWYFTHPVPLSAVSFSGDRPAEHALPTLPTPPDVLIYRGRVHGFEAATEGEYEEDGETTRKVTWDYWDATHADNLAVERWPDGTVECYHGRPVDPNAITVVSSTLVSVGSSSSALRVGMIVAGSCGFITMLVASAVEPALTVTLGALVLVVLIAALRSRRLALAWLGGGAVLAIVFSRFPPLTSLPGLAGLVLFPAVVTRWLTMREPGAPSLARAAGIAVAAATLVAGFVHYYRFAPAPRSFGQYMLAVGPAPIAGLAAALIAMLVVRAASR